jgi:hypothetical protein
MTPIRRAADAIAASHCLLSRQATSPEGGARASHPRECAWCSYDLAELTAGLDGFWQWSGSAHEVEVWESSPPVLQLRHLEEAQGYRTPHSIQAQEA